VLVSRYDLHLNDLGNDGNGNFIFLQYFLFYVYFLSRFPLLLHALKGDIPLLPLHSDVSPIIIFLLLNSPTVFWTLACSVSSDGGVISHLSMGLERLKNTTAP
jgi:hypothetical protein